MDIGSGSNCFDTTLKTSIITIVRCILNAQIINSSLRLEVDSVKNANIYTLNKKKSNR